MKMLTKEDVKALTADQKLELMDLLSESLEEDQIQVYPEVRDEVERRLKTYDEDKKTALSWRDAGLRHEFAARVSKRGSRR